MKDKGIISG